MIRTQDDNHPVVNAIKKKGWKIFMVTNSRIKNQYSGWWIDTSDAYGTKYGLSHQKIDCMYLGETIKDALYTINKCPFPIREVQLSIDELMEELHGKLKQRVVYSMESITEKFGVDTGDLVGTLTQFEWGIQYSRKDLK